MGRYAVGRSGTRIPYCHREGIQRLAMTIFFIYIRKRHRTGEESERTARPNRAFRPLSDAQIL